MADVFAHVASYFRERYEQFKVDDETQAVSMPIQVGNAWYLVRAQLIKSLERASFMVRDVMTVPEPEREAVCVLASLINWRLAVGDCWVEFEDGEAIVKLSFFVMDGALGQAQIRGNLGVIMNTSDLHYPMPCHYKYTL